MVETYNRYFKTGDSVRRVGSRLHGTIVSNVNELRSGFFTVCWENGTWTVEDVLDIDEASYHPGVTAANGATEETVSFLIQPEGRRQ